MENNSSFFLKGISSGMFFDLTFLTTQDAPQLQALDQIPPLQPSKSGREKVTSIVHHQVKAGGIAAYSESGVVRSLDVFSKAPFIKLKGYIKLNSFPNKLSRVRLHVHCAKGFPDMPEIYPTVLALCLWEFETAPMLIPAGLQIHLCFHSLITFSSSYVWDSFIENRYLVSLRVRTKDSSGAELCR